MIGTTDGDTHSTEAAQRSEKRAGGGALIVLAMLAAAVALGVADPGAVRSTLAGTVSAAAPLVAVPDAVAPVPSPSPTPRVTPPVTPGSRVGGSPGAPIPSKPGWIWWVAAALVAVVALGGFQLWRNREVPVLPADEDVADRASGTPEGDGY